LTPSKAYRSKYLINLSLILLTASNMPFQMFYILAKHIKFQGHISGHPEFFFEILFGNTAFLPLADQTYQAKNNCQIGCRQVRFGGITFD
jgi:hypothetical protein